MKYAKVYFEDVEVGSEMPPLVKGPIEQIQLTRYAGASGDFNPIHQDAAFARAAGMGDVITCRGKVVAKRPAKEPGRGPGQVDLELWAENQKGEKVVTGRATVNLVSRENE